MHRPDALVEPGDVAGAVDELEAAGKVRAFGVSNHTPRQIDVLKTAVRQPVVPNQVQLSIRRAPIVAQGMAANMQGLDQSIDNPDYAYLNAVIDRLVVHCEVPKIAIATARITRHTAKIQAALGTIVRLPGTF